MPYPILDPAPFLDEVGRLLAERYGVTSLMASTKVNFAQPAPDDLVKEMTTACDFVITGIGDCGSCSASAVADGIAFEAGGLPAAAICSDAFGVTADAMAELRGAPGYRYATTPHPVAVLTPDQGWSDGLPLVPASEPLIAKFLATTSRTPGEVIGELDQVGRNCTVYLAAVNAAMAGCLPEYFPVVLAAFDALMRERAARGGGWQSTSGPAPLIVVNGPVRHELDVNAAGGAFGPGFRPHVLEQATQGLPGRWSICLAENEEESPWPPFATDGGQPAGVSAVSAMLLRTCEFVDNRHTPDPEQVLWDIADTISRTGSLIFRDTSAGVVFCPEHAQLLAAAGFAKQDVQAWLLEHCGRTGADLRRAGKNGLRGIVRFADPDESADDTFTRILPSPRHVPIVVAGARNAAISMVVRVFGEWSGTASPVEPVPAAQVEARS